MKPYWTAFLLTVIPVGLWAQAPRASGVPPGDICTRPPAKSDKQTPETPCPASAPTTPPSASQRFPYPGETNTQAAPPAPATAAPQPGSASKQFPYPGDPSSSGSSGGTDSSSSSRSGADDASNADTPAPAAGRRILPKVKKLQSDEERESEDLDIAKYYRQAGNDLAAYLRAKDAVKLQPSDSEAHFALADAAQHLGKKDEAVAEYTAYLKLDPDGDRARNVRRALASLR